MRAGRPFGVVALRLGLGLGLVACGDDPGRTALDPSALDPAPFGAEPMASAVALRIGGCSLVDKFGVGSMVDHRLVLTAAHVVAGGRTIEATATDGRSAGGTVVHLDPDLDLALVELDHSLGTPLVLGRAGRDDLGSVVVHRDGSFRELVVEVVRPVTIRTEDIYIRDEVERPGYELAASIVNGDSGGVVVVGGAAVAVVWSRSTIDGGRAWAIDPHPIAEQIAGRNRSIPPDTHCVG
jgi:S1-C subfamily serine protease